MSYDGAGNVTQDANNRYVYDPEGRLCAVESLVGGTGATEYLYDAEGRRVAKGTLSGAGLAAAFPAVGSGVVPSCPAPTVANGFTLTSQYLLGLGGEQVTELNGAGTWVHTNVWQGARLAATYTSTGLHFDIADPLGTKRVQATVSSTGLGVAELNCLSLPFGNGLGNARTADCVAVGAGGVDATEQHFTGKERDAESGNDYFGARYYASSMGRFMSPDPSGLLAQKPSDPQSWNLYAYARNNPLMNIDPTGLDCVYANDAGNGVESIDHHSSSGECADSHGSWVPGYAPENWAHFNNNTGMFQVGSYTSGDSIDYTMFAAGATTQWNANESSCTSGCAGFASANADWLEGQLKSDGVPGLDQYVHFLTGREEPLHGGLGMELLAGPFPVGLKDNWAGPGGMGPPAGQGDWAASVHDYSFKQHDITIQNTGHYFGLHVSQETAKALIQSNNTLIRNAGGVQAIKMGLFFGPVNAFQWYASSWK